MSRGKYNTLIRLKAFKIIFVFCPKSTFFQGDSPRFLVKNDQILKSAFSLLYVPRDLSVSQKSLGNHLEVEITP